MTSTDAQQRAPRCQGAACPRYACGCWEARQSRWQVDPAHHVSAEWVKRHLTVFGYRVERQQEHSFISSMLEPGSVVVDLGLHRGEFADALVQDHGCRVFGVEPIRTSFDEASKVHGLTAECAAIAPRDGSVELHVHPRHGASVRTALAAASDERVVAQAVCLPSFVARHGLTRVDLLKMDVEGAEVDVLAALPASLLARIGQITVEFHDSVDATLTDGVDLVMERLSSLGFRVLRFSRNTHDVLFVNRASVPVSSSAAAWLLLRYKYLRGGRRLVRRLLG